MNLYLFPQAANDLNGYSIAVNAGYLHCHPKEDDVVVWYTTYPMDKMWYVRDSDYILKRPQGITLRRVYNVLTHKNSCQPSVSDLSFLRGKRFDIIHCDDVLFYPAVRKIFPEAKITVKFHNCFARILDRLNLVGIPVSTKYKTALRNMYHVERSAMRDSKVYKIFISKEDRSYYTSHFGKISDSEVFSFSPTLESVIKNRNRELHLDHRLVWFGGVEAHKKSSIEWFINSVFPKLREKKNDIEFHLWGARTEQFDCLKEGVFGHGFYTGDGLPSETSLYVNPDIIGGGVKIKLLTNFDKGIPFITSPFGFEGYGQELIDNKYCTVAEESNWDLIILKLLETYV